MLTLLQYNFKRLFKNRLLWSCIIITTVYFLLKFVIYREIEKIDDLSILYLADSYIESVTMTSVPVILSLFIIINHFGFEWKNDTYRNQILSGNKRSVIYFSGLLFSLIIFTFFILLTTFIHFTIGFAFGFKLFSSSIQPYAIRLFVILFNSLTVTVLVYNLITLVKNVGSTIAIIIGIYFVVSIASSFLSTGYIEIKDSDNVIHIYNTYPFNEFLMSYQNDLALEQSSLLSFTTYGISQNLDTAFIYVQEAVSESYFAGLNYQKLTGRLLPIMLKLIIKNIVYISGSITWAFLIFKKRDLN